MNNKENFNKACKETLEILENVEENDYNLIPHEFILKLKSNADYNYKSNINLEKDFNEQKLLPETVDILAYIYRRFWCNEREKKEFDKIIQENEINYQNELKDKYDIKNIFNKRNIKTNNSIDNIALTVIPKEQKLLKKILDFIKESLKNLNILRRQK